MNQISRRDFTKLSVAGSVAIAAAPAAKAQKPKTDVWVFHGDNQRALMEKCMETIFANGGFGIEKGKKIALKVNAAWERTPEQRANTNPDMVDVFLEKTLAAGYKVGMAELPCHRAVKSFPACGIEDVAKKYRIKLLDLATERNPWKEIAIPGGIKLQTENVAKEFLEADAIVNMPVAKHHGGGVLTICMKNWMGAVEGRKNWHGLGLHDCIADFSTFIKPTWAIVDAFECMTSKGPQGPSPDMIYPHQIILSKDQVAADTVTTLLFHDSQYKIKYLEIARERGIGETDINNMNIHRIEV